LPRLQRRLTTHEHHAVSESPHSPGLSTQRIEAFSDGVFAIAITLLILEIKIPTPPGPGTPPVPPGAPSHLTQALLHQWPSYAAYVLSFVMIGIYWANHHYIFHLYKRTNHVFNLLNVLFLMFISILPFPTALLGQFFSRIDERQSVTVLYATGLLMPALCWSLMWAYASHGYRLIDPRLEPEFVRHLSRQYLLSNLFYTLAIIASLFNALLGLTICTGLTFLYLLPPKKPVYLPKEP
jgi:uncharacterized membrane protein